MLVWLLRESLKVRVSFAFPPWSPLLARAGTLAPSVPIATLPLCRAVRCRPGETLRHA